MLYEGDIMTLPRKDQWDAIDYMLSVGAPNSLRPKGRLKKRSVKSFLKNYRKKIKSTH